MATIPTFISKWSFRPELARKLLLPPALKTSKKVVRIMNEPAMAWK